MGQNKHIDEEVRQKLENLEIGYDPTSWDMLAHRMDFEAQQEVDDLLKSRLEGLGVPLLPSNWDALEKMIEAEETVDIIESEAQLDNLAYDKLHNLQVPYKHHHWALMARRLEEEFSIRHQIYKYKVAEMALIALLLLTIVRFMPLMAGWIQSEQPTAQQAVQQFQKPHIGDVTGEQQNLLPNQLSNPTVEITQQAVAEKTQRGVDANRQKSEEGAQFPVSTEKIAAAQPDLNNTGSPAAEAFDFDKGSYRSDLQPVSVNGLTQLSHSSNSLSGFEERAEELLQREKFLLAQKYTKNNQPKLVNVLALGRVEPQYAWELPVVKVNTSKKKNDLRFSIFTTTDLNYVTTPPDQIRVFGEPVKTDYNVIRAFGYGGGVNISWKKDRWEYQTGGVYSFKRYIPNTPGLVYQSIKFYIKEDFNGIQLDIFQVPLNALYHFKNNGKWRFYASAGISGHFVTSTVYEIETEARDSKGVEGSPDDTRSRFKSYKEFPDGLLDGGMLRDNFYMSANLGLGAEHYLSPKWTLFFQPNYQHFMMSGGIGTNKDKIYTTSLYIGTKFNLK